MVYGWPKAIVYKAGNVYIRVHGLKRIFKQLLWDGWQKAYMIKGINGFRKYYRTFAMACVQLFLYSNSTDTDSSIFTVFYEWNVITSDD